VAGLVSLWVASGSAAHKNHYCARENQHGVGSSGARTTARARPGPGNSPENSVHNIVPIVAERAVGPGAYELALVAQVLALVA
jgi:hypothetical protein